jgi:cyclic-di-GMP phosphodiesterase TipF (flagellum assembly factor)
MSVFIHLLIIATYGIMAAAAGLVLSQARPDLPVMLAYGAAAAGFLVAVLVQEIVVRRLESRRFSRLLEDALDELDEMRHQHQVVLDDVARAREEMAALCDVVEGAADGANRTLVREVKVLQEQLLHLEGKKPRTKRKVEPARPAKAAAPAASPPTAAPVPAPSESADEEEPLELEAIDAVAVSVSEEEGVLDAAREALESNRIELFLQSVVSLPQRKTRFYEAYSRLRTESGALLTPDRYLDFAKEAGLMDTIDNLLLFRCVQLVRRFKRRHMDVAFFINISSNTLYDTDFLPQFAEFLQSNRAMAPSLIFEFAQADVNNFTDEVRDQLRRLALRGFRFSMDQVESLDIDVPTLEAIGFGFVKIPAPLLLADPSSSGGRFHPRDLKQLLERSSIDLIVEKIETENQVVEILDFDVDYGQGYLFGAPRQARDDAQIAA